jgi:predicted nucleic acid-binding protein
MKRVLIDTNVYIDFMNLGRASDVVLGGDLIRYTSSVVLMELQAGATNPSARKAVAHLASAFERTNRLLPPSATAWKRAGIVLRKLRESGREIRRASFVHDLLIALTARDIGATVVTSDESDYGAIRKHLDFSFEAVPRLP